MADKNLNMLIRLKKGIAADLADERAAFTLAQRIANGTRRSVAVRDENGDLLATIHPSSVDVH